MYAFRVPFIDDAYISFRYSQRLSDLGSLSWNDTGSPVLGTTSVAWTLLVSGLYSLGISVENAALLLTVLIVWLLLFSLHDLTMRILEQTSSRETHVAIITTSVITIAAINMPTRTGLFSGMETALYCLLVLRGLVALDARGSLAGVYAGLATLTRPDGAILLPLALVLGSGRRLLYASTFLLVTVPWFFYSYRVYGELLPGSVEAKRLLYPSPWLKNFFMLFEAHSANPVAALLFCLAGAGLCAGFSIRCVRPFLWWLSLYAGGIAISGIKPIFFWYFTPTWLFGTVLGGAAGAAWLLKRGRLSSGRLSGVLTVGAGLIAVYSLSHDVRYESSFLRELRYREIVQSFRDEISPADTILAGEVGIIAFGFPKNEVIDSSGINSREVLTVLKDFKDKLGIDKKFVHFVDLQGWNRLLIERFEPTVIIAARSRFGLDLLEHELWFNELYDVRAILAAEHVGGIGVYRRK